MPQGGEELTLRIRQPKININCSFLLTMMNPEDGKKTVWDCIRVYEERKTQYTEEGWVEKYERLISFESEEEKTMIIKMNDHGKEEDDGDRMKFKAKPAFQKSAEYTLLSTIQPEELEDTVKITHCAWKSNPELHTKGLGFLELQLTQTLPSKKKFIGQIKTTNMLLKFKDIHHSDSHHDGMMVLALGIHRPAKRQCKE